MWRIPVHSGIFRPFQCRARAAGRACFKRLQSCLPLPAQYVGRTRSIYFHTYNTGKKPFLAGSDDCPNLRMYSRLHKMSASCFAYRNQRCDRFFICCHPIPESQFRWAGRFLQAAGCVIGRRETTASCSAALTRRTRTSSFRMRYRSTLRTTDSKGTITHCRGV